MSDLSIETPINRCSRIKRNGERCKRPPIRGGTVCASHGGRAPAVRAKAQMRLLMSADKLMAGLLKIADDTSVPTAVRLAAIRDALDRAGLGTRQAIDVDVAVGLKQSPADRFSDVVESFLEPIDRAHWNEDFEGPWPYGNFDSYGDWIAAGSPGLPPSQRAALDANVIDAEIVDDEHESAFDLRTEVTERERAKRRRRGLDPELPPAVERRLGKDNRRTAAPPIEQDPRSLPPVARQDDLNRNREAFLIERLDLDPRKKRRRRRT